MTEQPASSFSLSGSSLVLSELCDACSRLTHANWTKTPEGYFSAEFDSSWIIDDSPTDIIARDAIREVPCRHDHEDYTGPFRPLARLARSLLPQVEAAANGPCPAYHLNLEGVKARSQRCHLCSSFYRLFKTRGSLRGDRAPQLTTIAEDEFSCIELLPILGTQYHKTISYFDGMSVDERVPVSTLTCYLVHRKRLDQYLDNALVLNYHSIENLDPNVKQSLLDSQAQTVYAGGFESGLGCSIKQGTLDRIQAWLRNCSRHHEPCHKFEATLNPGSESSFNPTRLLEISMIDEGTLRLRETALSGEIVDYVTLSHRWPSKLDCLLNSDTYKHLLRGVPLTSVPRTFRDAALMTHALGYQYIWIDALCIQQDSRADWSRESATMASVYTHGAVNLAATYAIDSYGGLFGQSKDLCDSKPLIIQADWGDRSRLLQQYVLLSEDRWTQEVHHAELNSRGWVFQESILARRTIHFASDQIRWSCNTMREAENICQKYGKATTRLVDMDESDNRLMTADWMDILTTYSGLTLTRSGDTFAAIGGVARSYASLHGYQEADYMMGLWRPRLAQQLLWQVGGRTRRSEPIAPSWSWAYFEGSFDACLGETWLSGTNVQFHPNVQVMNGTSGYPSETTFVHPRIWRLCMKGLLHRVVLMHGKLAIADFVRPTCGQESWLDCTPDQETDSQNQDEDEDEEEDEAEAEQCGPLWTCFHVSLDETCSQEELHAFFLPLIQVVDLEWTPVAAVHGLLLERSRDDDGTYRRLGRLQICPGRDYHTDLTGLPEWWRGADLSPDEYKVNHGNGCYEFEII